MTEAVTHRLESGQSGLYARLIGDWLNFQLLLSLAVIVAAGFYATIATPYEAAIIAYTIVFAIMGLGWVIAAGFAGQLLIGYISFFGLGAYVNAILFTKFGISPWMNLGLAAACGYIVGMAAAGISGRFGLNEDYFGLFTVALTQIFKVIFLNWSFAGKATGIRISRLETDYGTMRFLETNSYVFVALAILVAVVLLTYALLRGRIGLKFAAVREGAVAAEALGVNVSRIRLHAVGISGAVAGTVGAFYSQFTGFIDPEKVFGLALNFDFLLPPVIGGRLSIIGPLLGSALLRPIKDVLRGMLGGEADALYLIIYGLVLIVGILVLPKGIAGVLERLHVRYLSGSGGAK